VTGVGAHKLTGPRMPSLSSAYTMPAAASERETQERAWLPDPITPPPPVLNSKASFATVRRRGGGLG